MSVCAIGTAHQMLPQLFVSAYPCIPYRPEATESIARKWITKYKIKHVVNCTHEEEKFKQFNDYVPVWKKLDDTVQFHRISIKDCETTDDETVMAMVKFIEEWFKKGENVLVHCHFGRGRSGTIAAIVAARALKTDLRGVLRHTDQRIQKRSYKLNRYHKPGPLKPMQVAQVARLII